MELVPQKFGSKKPIALPLDHRFESRAESNFKSSSTMNNQTNRVELLKAVKSAVNAASFSTTEGRVKEAKAAVRDLMAYLDSLESTKKNASKKRKRKQKSGKATAATRVADKQEKAFHGKADTPVTPSTRKPKASVEAARKAAQDVSRHTGAESRAKRKAEAVKKAVVMPKAAPMKVTSDDRVASLEAKLEQLTATLAVMMASDVTPTANEVCFSDLPFDPTC
jgi:hypothetical protein